MRDPWWIVKVSEANWSDAWEVRVTLVGSGEPGDQSLHSMNTFIGLKRPAKHVIYDSIASQKDALLHWRKTGQEPK